MACWLMFLSQHFFKVTPILRSYASAPARWSKWCVPVAAMATKATEDAFRPPVCTLPEAGGMLNRDLFVKTLLLPAVRFNKKLTSVCLRALKSKALTRKPFLRNNPSNPDEKVLLLNPEVVSSGDVLSLGEAGAGFLKEHSLEGKFGEYQLELRYSDWTSEEVLRSLLPKGVEVPTGFSRIGHIAHLNLRPEQLKYKHVIGEVLMDKNPGLKTVVNKTGEINNEFRFFSMELLAGENNLIAMTKEHGNSFEFDFSKVYWNPRLSTEHARIVGLLNRGDVVYDVFAGVGPFAVPAAKKGCDVLANDLNPESFKWLQRNIKLNKIEMGLIKAYNLDGREFIKEVVRKDLIKRAEEWNTESNPRQRTHVVMNLPSLAMEFLDAFPDLLRNVAPGVRGRIGLPTVHCHCFSKEADAARDVRHRIEAVLSHSIEGALIHDVRDVAPNKEMMCASFELPGAVVFGDSTEDSQAAINEPQAKKSRTE
ncbi:tRNA (guanine(37)-N1)-methyltransferase-like [Acanthaster planci]|uniref:tRNA (guanine(37)-N1)-methyltransferase n=1 Tax=Acanthaster planci TaxID=133434 RepID=A0A8B7Y9S9_ACAPL|nr:tRNA (guanine(37)-N1)-methyltransferase-like [Acanthaster planci]XP_022089129.1 tRNA (guanine(37)-N1)-methyltransferase-like [Acanthaster planci]XP_022089130.1 tRNA (guanine(37)-N1)-methyltransferase-like [Acanthaster planci]XP_022089131.1 tRNA (guanine(37)-N1)-methyltransferase-like [Acanthaster planci]XP_022089132.1 tRNA (guanine(37)-N1)-methyltransferase-like [Acanthaster planci]